MKRLTVILAVLLSIGMLWATPPNYYQYNPNFKQQGSNLIAGEHTSVIYSGTDTVANGVDTESVTAWLQIGYALTYAERANNKKITYFNPEVFTVEYRAAGTTTGGDSVSLIDACAEFVFDTTQTDRIRLTLTNNQPAKTFTYGELITTNTSGAYGTIVDTMYSGADTFLVLHSIEGVFDVATPDSITGGTSGTSATISAKSSIWGYHAWNADSSNFFLDTGQYTHLQYGTWRYLPPTLVDTGRVYRAPVRVWAGGYMRLHWYGSGAINDTTIVPWRLICEN